MPPALGIWRKTKIPPFSLNELDSFSVFSLKMEDSILENQGAHNNYSKIVVFDVMKKEKVL